MYRLLRSRIFPLVFFLGACLLAGGCQVQAVSTIQLQEHQQVLDLLGLMPVQARERLGVSVAAPEHWQALVPSTGLFYLHQQWRSPRHNAGMGVVYIQAPLPVSAKMLVWLASIQYKKQEKDSSGQILSQWTDALQREWFDAENSRYHIRGYAMTRGAEAWIVYSGYRLDRKPSPHDLELAQRAADSVAPLGR